MVGFESATINQKMREDNSLADILSKLVGSKQKGLHDTVIQQILCTPSVGIEECMMVEKEGVNWIFEITSKT